MGWGAQDQEAPRGSYRKGRKKKRVQLQLLGVDRMVQMDPRPVFTHGSQGAVIEEKVMGGKKGRGAFNLF